MGKEQIISKGKYSYAQPSDMIGVKQYLFVKEEDGKKRLLLRFFNDRRETCNKFAFILYRLDSKGNVLGQDKFESADRDFLEKEVFSFDRKILVEEKCTDFKVQMVYARYGNYTYNVEHTDVSVSYSEKIPTAPGSVRSITKIKPRKMHTRSFDMPWIFAALSLIILALAFAACGFLLNDYKKTKYDFTLSGVNYKFNRARDEVTIVGCSDKYREITLNSEIEGYKIVGIDEDAFAKNKNLVTVKINGLDIPDGAFERCTKLEVVKLTGVSYIGQGAFSGCSSLKRVEINEGEKGQLLSIGSAAFGGCKALKTVKINQTLAYGDRVDFFKGSNNIETLELNNFAFTLKDVNSKYVTRLASLFGEEESDKSSSKLVSLRISNMDAVPNNFVQGFTKLQRVEIGSEIKTVGAFAFDGCSSLNAYTANGQLVSIGDYAFSGTDIAGLDMSKVTNLGEGVFKNNDKLTGVTGFGESGLDNIPKGTFEGCTSLAAFTFHKNIKHVFSSAFAGSGLTKIAIPQGVSYDDGILKDCRSLKELEVYEFGSAGYVGQLFGGERTADSNTLSSIIPRSLEKITLGTGTTINADAFKGCSSVTTIKLPAEIEVIGKNAFSGCAKLTAIDIPKESTTLKRIEAEAFSGCAELKYVPLLESLEYIGENALMGCNKLEALELPFFGATPALDDENETMAHIFGVVPDSLKEIYLLDSTVSYLPDEAFSHCTGVKTISIPNTVTTIGAYAFNNCTALTSLVLSDGTSAGKTGADLTKVINISEYAFYKCSALSSVNLGAELSIVDKYAFAGSGLKTVIVPSCVDLIGEGVFKNCDGIGTMTVPYLGSTSAENGKLSYFFDGKVPSSLKSVKVMAFKDNVIGAEAFEGCDGLVTVELPEGLVAVGEEAFNGCTALSTFNFSNITVVDKRAFKGCTALKGVDLSRLEAIGEAAFKDCEAISKAELSSTSIIEGEAFDGCTSLTDLSFGDFIYKIGESAFNSTGIKSVKLPDTVEVIEANTFANCPSLVSVTLPSYLKEIGSYAFESAPITSIKIPESVTSIGAYAFKNTGLKAFAFPTEITEIGKSVLFGCNSIESLGLTLTNEFIDTKISSYLFEDAMPESLKSVTINGSTYGYIQSGAFAYANYIEEVIIKGDITYIAWEAFNSCGELRYVSLPETLELIEPGAFAYCYRLYEISNPSICPVNYEHTICYTPSYEDRAPVIEKDGYKAALYDGEWYLINYPRQATVSTPADFVYWGETVSEYRIPDYLFYNDKTVTEVTLKEPVTAIGCSSFSGCDNLTKATLSKNIESIGDYAFYECYQLSNVAFPSALVSIGDYAFAQCAALNGVKLYRNVASIGENAFVGCESLYDVYNESYLNIVAGSRDYGNVARNAVKVHKNMDEALSFEVRVNGIGTFRTTKDAWLLISGDDVEDLKLDSFKYDGATVKSYRIAKYAFEACRRIKKITIGDAVKEIQEGAFENCSGVELLDCSQNTSLKEIEARTFAYCYGLRTAKLPSSVKTIGDYAFNGCTRLLYVDMPKALVTIKDGAFMDCGCLISITLNSDVREIGDDAFNGCQYLMEVYDLSPYITVEGNSYANGMVGYYGATVFTNPYDALTRKEEDGMKLIYASSTWYLYDFEDEGKEIIELSNQGNDLIIMPYAMQSGEFKGIVLPANLEAVMSNAFDGCYSLESIYYAGSWSDFSAIDGSYIMQNTYRVYMKGDCVHYGEYDVWRYDEKGNVTTEMCAETEKVIKEATCYEYGTRKYSCNCSGCDYTREEGISRLDHTFINGKCKSCGEIKTQINGENLENYTNSGVIDSDGFEYSASKNAFVSQNKDYYSESYLVIEADNRMTVTFTMEASCTPYSDYLAVYVNGARGQSVTGKNTKVIEIRLEAGDVLMVCFEKGDIGSQNDDCGYIKDLCIIEAVEEQTN